MAKQFIECDELKEIANKVIEEKKMDWLVNVPIKYILVDPYISKQTAAKCMRANDDLEYFGQFKYLLKFSNKVWEKLDERLKKILVWHELKHILIVNTDGGVEYKILPHDVQDFYEIIKEHGIGWLEGFRAIVASIYDLTPADKDRITI